MSMLRGFLILVLFFLLGEALRLVFQVPVSGGVLGMILMTFTLMLRGRVSDALALSSQALISILVLLIMPGVVGVFFMASRFSDQWLAMAAALLLGTFLSVLSTLLLMKGVMRLSAREQGHD
ncbi:CidA/LrgA family protein [Marinobacter sp. F3R11]|uniref:CidA/LrgA family protein n=1 Tax=Marinobacter sp. F3R11 TaxID=2267231 RepID=UPI000DEBB014|nr:CidA/LrgA family protein [Marinobacter sp. F3R11]RBW51195.1 CidA/LrgA family protein [Marinobacter sp. F3R11]